MGLDLQFLRFVNDEGSNIGPITLECTSEEAKTAPEFWVCGAKLELQEEGIISLVAALSLPIFLEKVRAIDVPACSVFQDTGGGLPVGEIPPPPPPPG